MSFLGKLLVKEEDKKPEINELFSDSKEEHELLEEFIKLHQQKINDVKRIRSYWIGKGGKDQEKVESIMERLPDTNSRLRGLIQKIRKIDEREETILSMIIAHLLHAQDNKVFAARLKNMNKKPQEILDKTKEYLKRITEDIDYLSKILLRQNQYISELKGFKVSKFLKDLEEHQHFYHLLYYEKNLANSLFQYVSYVISEVNSQIGYMVRESDLEPRFDVKGERRIVTKSIWGLNFEDIINPDCSSFEKFYENYVEAFPDPDEQESKSKLKEVVDLVYKLETLEETGTNLHLILAKLKDEVVGSALVEFMSCEEYCFGVIWYIIVIPKMRNSKVAHYTLEKVRKIFNNEARVFGYKGLDCIFFEVNNPYMMSREEAGKDITYSLDPHDRVYFWVEKQDAKILDFRYIQPALSGSSNPVYYLYLMMIPFNKEWIKLGGIPKKTMDTLLRKYVTVGFERAPDKDPSFLEMKKDLSKRDIVRFKTLKHDFRIRYLVRGDMEPIIEIASKVFPMEEDIHHLQETLEWYFKMREKMDFVSGDYFRERSFYAVHDGYKIVGVAAFMNSPAHDEDALWSFLYPLEGFDADHFFKAVQNTFTGKYRIIVIEIEESNSKSLENSRFDKDGFLPEGPGSEGSAVFSLRLSRKAKTPYKIYKILTSHAKSLMKDSSFNPNLTIAVEYFAGIYNGEMVGMTGIYENGWFPNASGLGWFMVSKEYQGKSCGKDMINKMEEIARKRGHGHIYVETDQTLKTANKFYRSRGYKNVITIRDFYGQGIHMLIYAKKL